MKRAKIGRPRKAEDAKAVPVGLRMTRRAAKELRRQAREAGKSQSRHVVDGLGLEK